MAISFRANYSENSIRASPQAYFQIYWLQNRLISIENLRQYHQLLYPRLHLPRHRHHHHPRRLP